MLSKHICVIGLSALVACSSSDKPLAPLSRPTSHTSGTRHHERSSAESISSGLHDLPADLELDAELPRARDLLWPLEEKPRATPKRPLFDVVDDVIPRGQYCTEEFSRDLSRASRAELAIYIRAWCYYLSGSPGRFVSEMARISSSSEFAPFVTADVISASAIEGLDVRLILSTFPRLRERRNVLRLAAAYAQLGRAKEAAELYAMAPATSAEEKCHVQINLALAEHSSHFDVPRDPSMPSECLTRLEQLDCEFALKATVTAMRSGGARDAAGVISVCKPHITRFGEARAHVYTIAVAAQWDIRIAKWYRWTEIARDATETIDGGRGVELTTMALLNAEILGRCDEMMLREVSVQASKAVARVSPSIRSAQPYFASELDRLGALSSAVCGG